MEDRKRRFTAAQLLIVFAVTAALAVILTIAFGNWKAEKDENVQESIHESIRQENVKDTVVQQEAKNALTTYIVENDGICPKVMLYYGNGRWIAMCNGALTGAVYSSKEEALAAVTEDPDLTRLRDTGDGHLFVYEDISGDTD